MFSVNVCVTLVSLYLLALFVFPFYILLFQKDFYHLHLFKLFKYFSNEQIVNRICVVRMHRIRVAQFFSDEERFLIFFLNLKGNKRSAAPINIQPENI